MTNPREEPANTSVLASLTDSRHAPLVLGLILGGLLCVFISYFCGFPPHQASYFLLGVAGALFANSTGAGGGVVFIPVFHHLGFSDWQAVGTSVGIQCFGMTAGAVAWSRYYRGLEGEPASHWLSLVPAILICAGFSIAGIWVVYGFSVPAPAGLREVFKMFSLVLGLGILATLFFIRGAAERVRFNAIDRISLAIISLVGGMITAWLSVGVGEVVALYLILRRFDVTFSVAVAVIISSISVWVAMPEHFILRNNGDWSVVMFAGPGAVLGAVLARRLATWLSTRGLKAFFGLWLLVLGILG